MHKFPKDANLRRQWVKFVQVKRADFEEPSVHCHCRSHFSTDCYEKSYMAEMGLKKQKQLLPGAVPTIQALPETNSSEGKKRPIRDSEEPAMSDRTGKNQEVELFNRISQTLIYVQILRMIQNKTIYCLKPFFLSQFLKDYEEASCSGASFEPIVDLDLSDLMSETGPNNKERIFNDVSIQCDIVVVWLDLQRK